MRTSPALTVVAKIRAAKGKGEARKVKIDANTRSLSFILDDTDDGTGTYVQSGVLGPDGVVRGTGLDPDGNIFQWTMTRDAGAPEEPGDETEEADANLDGRWPITRRSRGAS